MNHVLVTGQSLSTGSQGSPALSRTPLAGHWCFANLKLDGLGAALPAPEDLNSLGSLAEGLDASYGVETIATGFAWYVGSQASGHRLLVSNWGKYGSAYAALARSPASGSPNVQATGTAPYLRGLNQVLAGRRLLGSRLQVRALLVVHGEADVNNASYDANIRQWQLDAETDYNALTGQSGRIPMFHSQHSSWSAPVLGSQATATSPFKLYSEHKANPTKTTLVCPKYFLAHDPTDGGHLTASSYRWLGAYYGKAYAQQVVSGTQWEPLRPASVTRTANVIDVMFTGNVGQLVLDTGLVSNPGSYGFEYFDDGATPSITGVTITGTNSVRVTLASTPAGANKKLRYGYTATAGNFGGPTTGPRGCLRDSDPARGMAGEALYNWCVHFEELLA